MANTRIFSSSVWNLSGGILPILVGVFLLPPLIERVGIERFGILTLAWVVIGYFSVFDLGLGRALTKLVAERTVGSDQSSLPGLVWTSQVMMAGVGLFGTVIVVFGSKWFVNTALGVAEELELEAVRAFLLLSYVIPFITTSAGFRGFLEAHHRFDLVNMVRIPLGLFMFAGPLLASFYEPTLDAMVFTLVVARLVSWLIYMLMCMLVDPALRSRPRFVSSEVRPLMSFGGWMTVSNIVGPVMLYLDRFLIGAMVSALAVAYYATPYEVITKFLIVPAAIASAQFPALSQAMVRGGSETVRIYRTGITAIFLLLWLPVAVAGAFAPELLFLWLGEDFAVNSANIVRWLAIGVFVNSLAHVPFYFVQSAGRPDIAARIHLIELPVYIAALYMSLATFGAVGAALTWTIRVAIDAIVFMLLAARLHAPLRTDLLRIFLGMTFAIIAFVLVYWPTGIIWRGVLLFFMAFFLTGYAWIHLLAESDRQFVLRHRFFGILRNNRFLVKSPNQDI